MYVLVEREGGHLLSYLRSSILHSYTCMVARFFVLFLSVRFVSRGRLWLLPFTWCSLQFNTEGAVEDIAHFLLSNKMPTVFRTVTLIFCGCLLQNFLRGSVSSDLSRSWGGGSTHSRGALPPHLCMYISFSLAFHLFLISSPGSWHCKLRSLNSFSLFGG